jgi:hypothetical protein
VDAVAAMIAGGRRQTGLCDAFKGNAGERMWNPPGYTRPDKPSSPICRDFSFGKFSGGLWTAVRKITITSSRASICGRRDQTIRKKVIGHSVSVLRKRFSGANVFLHLLRTLALLDQPACQHGGGVLLHPEIEKRANLLAQIGSMAKTREFIALERVSRSREKELPRGLGFEVIHMGLLESGFRKLTLRKKLSRITTG